MGEDLTAFLADQGVPRGDVVSWVCHPGGPKVLLAFEDALGLTRHDVQLTWDSLREVGNLSSASVLHVLKDTMEQRRPDPGAHGMMLAMGPGFCSEFVLLRW
jgi:alkylresorcinol/alkylpyrone synthase